MSRPLRVLIVTSLLLTACGTDEPDGPAVERARERELGVVEGAVSCAASLKTYPVSGKHNGGWDKNALTFTCPVHPASSPDNSDFIGGDHYGNDIFAAKGTPLVACVDGTVVGVANTSIGGKNVTIKDKCGWYYYYAHMDSIGSDIKQGMGISAGKKIGTLGKTGSASTTSPHLHFSVYPGTYSSGIDPYPLLKKVDATSCGGSTAPTLPVMDITSKTAAKDTRPEGKSSGIGDVFEGDSFKVNIYVVDKASGAKTKDHVLVGYWVESPYLTPTAYTIYTDWPAKDGKTWKVNDSNAEAKNPSHTNPPASGKIDIYGLSPGETKRIELTVKAVQYSIGAVDHPDVRAWVWHVGSYYGEMTGFYDAVETNKAGKLLRTYQQHDVYGKTHWEWNGTEPETEGWAKVKAVSALKVNEKVAALAIQQGGKDPHVKGPVTSFSASKYKGVELRVRQYDGKKEGQLFWLTKDDGAWSESKSAHFLATGDGDFHKVTVNTSLVPAWKGTITQLRLDPTEDSTGWYDVDWLRAVEAPGATSGDADGDGVLAGADCDDKDPGVKPGAAEACNGKDDDCDGKTDEGFGVGEACEAGVGACHAAGVVACSGGKPKCNAKAGAAAAESCDGVDNDCDGATDEDFGLGDACEVAAGACLRAGKRVCTPGGAVVCNAGAPMAAAELCNGQDDDCDGEVDEGFGVGEACTKGLGECAVVGAIACAADGGATCVAEAVEPGAERCDGLDNDCDGEADDGYVVGVPCAVVEGGCTLEGEMSCAPDGASTFCLTVAPEGPCAGAGGGGGGEADADGGAGAGGGEADAGAGGGGADAGAGSPWGPGPADDDAPGWGTIGGGGIGAPPFGEGDAGSWGSPSGGAADGAGGGGTGFVGSPGVVDATGGGSPADGGCGAAPGRRGGGALVALLASLGVLGVRRRRRGIP